MRNGARPALPLLAMILGAGLLGACRPVSQRVENTPPPGKPAPPRPGVESYSSVVDRVIPAVVTIRSQRRVRAPRQFPFPFPFSFGPSQRESQGEGAIQYGLGSGVIVTADGHCLTNHHVVDGAEEIRVELRDGRVMPARLLGSDAPSDLAVLDIDGNNLAVLPLGDSDAVRVGDVVLAVGNPLGVGTTVTMGIISAKGRTTGLSDGTFEDFLQTDTAINRGNSGGPLVNTNAELIGINSQILSPTGASIGIGFSIPSNMAHNVMDQLVRTGHVRRGQLGVSIQRVTPEMSAALGLKEARGQIINSVTAGGPADRAGLKRGDVIVALNGDPVEDGNKFRNKIATTAPGSEVTLTVIRDGNERKVTVKLGEFQMAEAGGDESPAAAQTGASGKLGISVVPLTPSLAAQLGVDRGASGVVVTTVDPEGPAGEAGVRTGDVLLEVNRKPVRSAADVTGAMSGSGPLLMLLDRKGQTFFVTVQPGS